MSSTTTNIGLVKMASGETIGQWSDANNGSGANLDKIDTAIGNMSSQISDKIKCIRMNVELDAQGMWQAWNYNIGYTNYQLLKAFVFSWNDVTVVGANNGFWQIKVDGLASQTVNVCFVIALAPIPNS